jgi:hypothetical protein
MNRKQLTKEQQLKSIWNGMKRRCQNPKDSSYPNYGSRGISVCDDWLNFENFSRDLLASYPGQNTGYSLDRINTNGHYELGNCKWSTQKEQCRNKRNNVKITFQGKEYTNFMCFSEYVSELTGLHTNTIRGRHRAYRPEIHGDFDSFILADLHDDEAGCRPCTVEGKEFRSQKLAAEFYGKDSTLISHRASTLEKTFVETLLLPEEYFDARRRSNSQKIIWSCKLFSSQVALAKHLGIKKVTLRQRIRLYGTNELNWDEQLSKATRVCFKPITLFGVEYESNTLAAKQFGVDRRKFCGWVAKHTIQEIEQKLLLFSQ